MTEISCDQCSRNFNSEQDYRSHCLFVHGLLRPQCVNWHVLDRSIAIERINYRYSQLYAKYFHGAYGMDDRDRFELIQLYYEIRQYDPDIKLDPPFGESDVHSLIQPLPTYTLNMSFDPYRADRRRTHIKYRYLQFYGIVNYFNKYNKRMLSRNYGYKYVTWECDDCSRFFFGEDTWELYGFAVQHRKQCHDSDDEFDIASA